MPVPSILWWEPISDGTIIKNLRYVDMNQIYVVFNLSNEVKYEFEFQNLEQVLSDIGAYLAFMSPFLLFLYSCFPKQKPLQILESRLHLEEFQDQNEDNIRLKEIIEKHGYLDQILDESDGKKLSEKIGEYGSVEHFFKIESNQDLIK